MSEHSAPRPPRVPITVLLLLGVGLIGGLAGGIAVALVLMAWSAIESGGQDFTGAVLLLGAYYGTILGAAMAVIAVLLRLVALALRTGVRGELVAVSIGAFAAPFAFLAVLSFWGWYIVAPLVIGGLAALQFCRTVLKRHRAEAREISPASESL